MNLQQLINLIREELQAEGPGGGGYSDEFIRQQINNVQAALAEYFPIRDMVTFTATKETNEYTLDSLIDSITIENIIRVEYNGNLISYISIDDYLAKTTTTDGVVLAWTLWGTKFILVGEVEAVTVKLWVNRLPANLVVNTDTIELPVTTVPAITAYVCAACNRESRNSERAGYYFNIYLAEKNNLIRRGTPQGHKAGAYRMRDSYWESETAHSVTRKSDTNPGGY